jgi:hypothetical protein
MKLRYDRNYAPKGESECVCPTCGVVCGSTRAFDTHLVSSDGSRKICLKNPEMHPRLEIDPRGRLAMKQKTPRKINTGANLDR